MSHFSVSYLKLQTNTLSTKAGYKEEKVKGEEEMKL